MTPEPRCDDCGAPCAGDWCECPDTCPGKRTMPPGLRETPHGSACLSDSHPALGALAYDELYLVELAVAPDDRERGHGSALLGSLCREADEHAVTLILHPATAAEVPTDEQLEAWYRRHGFEPDTHVGWRRSPRPLTDDLPAGGTAESQRCGFAAQKAAEGPVRGSGTR